MKIYIEHHPFRKLFHLLLLFCVSAAHAEKKYLQEPKVTDLSIKAIAGDKKALQKLIKEFRRYEQLIKQKKPFTLAQEDLYTEIESTLELKAPRILSPSRDASYSKKVTVEQPIRRRFVQQQSKIKVKQLNKDTTKYFTFNQGTTSTFFGKMKTLLTEEWAESGRILKSQVLLVTKKKGEATEVVTLKEIYNKKGGWLAEQTIVTYFISPTGIWIHKDVVFNQPTPGTVAKVGEQEPYPLVKFPLRSGEVFEGYQVKNISATIKTATSEFSNCLVIGGQVEELAFAPNVGLVSMEFFDEKWILEKNALDSLLSASDVLKHEEKSLEKAIKRFCRKNGLRLKSVLSLRIGVVAPSNSVWSNILVYKKDNSDPDQKRYKTLKQKWARKMDGKKLTWVLR